MSNEKLLERAWDETSHIRAWQIKILLSSVCGNLTGARTQEEEELHSDYNWWNPEKIYFSVLKKKMNAKDKLKRS